MGCMVASDKGKMNNLVDGLRHKSFESYASIRYSVYQSLLAVGSRLREVIDCEAKELQRGFHNALLNTAGKIQQWFANASEVVDRSLSLIVRHATHNKLARPGFSTVHSANRDH